MAYSSLLSSKVGFASTTFVTQCNKLTYEVLIHYDSAIFRPGVLYVVEVEMFLGIIIRIGMCRRPSAVVNLNCVTNRVAQGPRYKLSYDARTIQHTHSS